MTAEELQNNPAKKGGISVETEHIFPIIKKWLYSEKDIFLREIVSNATDAITKMKRLASLGEIDAPEEPYQIRVTLDKEQKTLTVSDNGIGMTGDELEKYICSIALSGAVEFIQKYESSGEKGDDTAKNGIIGHFGLGFYSSFMVSDTVELVTKSYTGAPALRWVCSDAGEYEIFPSDKETRGTDVIMHIADGEEAYLEEYKIREMLDKYCAFMPVEIYFTLVKEDDESEPEKEERPEEERPEEEKPEEEKPKEEKPINDTCPLWLKNPSDCTPEEYKDFYRKVFHDYKEPLFWIHINADYPLNFKGILYFPKFQNEYESIEGQVKLFYNQVFVADNIKEVIPDYLLMLKGVLDCPELPLNVSRSYLQNNSYVSKVSSHIVKKVADKLNSLCNTERETYEKVYDDIRAFVEFACMKDRKFYDRVKNAILLKLCDGRHLTLDEYLEKAKETNEKTVYYATDKALQAQYIKLFTDEKIEVALFEQLIDTQFATLLENYSDGVKFIRVDADVASAMKGDGEISENAAMADLFRKVSANEKLTVKFDNLKSKVPAILNVPEESRRMEEMMKLYRMEGFGNDESPLPTDICIVLNLNAPLIQKLSGLIENGDGKADTIASYIYKLALLSQRKLSAEEMQNFLSDGFSILEQL